MYESQVFMSALFFQLMRMYSLYKLAKSALAYAVAFKLDLSL